MDSVLGWVPDMGQCLSQSTGLSSVTLGKSFNLSPYHCSVSEMKINGSNAPGELNVLVITRGSDENEGEINTSDRIKKNPSSTPVKSSNIKLSFLVRQTGCVPQ